MHVHTAPTPTNVTGVMPIFLRMLLRLVGAGEVWMWGGDACVAPVPVHPAPPPLPPTGSPVVHKGRYLVKRAEKGLRLVGAGEVWMWGGDACVAPVPVHPAPSPLPATGSPVAHKGRYFVKRAEKRLRLVGAGEVWMWGGDACVAPVPVHPAPSPLPATGSPVAHKGRYFVKRAEKRLRLVGAGEVWMWGGDACVAPVPVHPAPSPLPATGSPPAPCIVPPCTLPE